LGTGFSPGTGDSEGDVEGPGELAIGALEPEALVEEPPQAARMAPARAIPTTGRARRIHLIPVSFAFVVSSPPVYRVLRERTVRCWIAPSNSHPILMPGARNCCPSTVRGGEVALRILVVEDELKMARAIRRGLEHEGYAVDVAVEGEDALFRATEYEYDALVLDVMLPRMDGFVLCEALRKEGRWVPVLMLTARDGLEDRIRGLDVGADDYLIKPFAFGELLARLRALIRRGPSERPAVIRVGDVTLDPAAHTVTRGERPVQLSPREFALLEFLMRSPGEVLSRSRILEHVWDYNYEGFSNVVDVYVGYLRRKLEAPFGRPFIRTVRGIGYAVGAE
jgi:two-component system OmpR family response regulator